MRRIFLYLFFIVLSVGSISTGGVLRALSPETRSTSVAVMGRQLYEEMRLDQWVCFDAFMQGLRGSEKIDRKNKDILTLIDFSKPSTAERMVVLDIRQKRILYTSLVSHGKNSGELCDLFLERERFPQKLFRILSDGKYVPRPEWLFAYPKWIGKRNK